jgi:hypothetical protein
MEEKVMSPEEFAKAMNKMFDNQSKDKENAHRSADALMLKILTDLGYGEGVEAFKKMPKWYS